MHIQKILDEAMEKLPEDQELLYFMLDVLSVAYGTGKLDGLTAVMGAWALDNLQFGEDICFN